MRTIAGRTIGSSLAYVLAILLVEIAVLPVTRGLAGDRFEPVVLVFLPHGVKVPAAWLYGWWSILHLLPGFLLAHFVLQPDPPIFAGSLTLTLIYLGNAIIAFEIFARAGFDLMGPTPGRLNWRGVVLVGAVASLISALVGLVLLEVDAAAHEQVALVLLMMFGDVIGLVVLMAATMLAFRHLRRRA